MGRGGRRKRKVGKEGRRKGKVGKEGRRKREGGEVIKEEGGIRKGKVGS